jgi:hypothetical protein
MCQYMKDDGEQCGMDTEPFCRHHEDTQQAVDFHTTTPQGNDFVSAAFSDAQSDSIGVPMGTTCSECETELRRRERLTEHPNMGHRLVFEAYAECDCSEYVFASKSVGSDRLPDGWS